MPLGTAAVPLTPHNVQFEPQIIPHSTIAPFCNYAQSRSCSTLRFEIVRPKYRYSAHEIDAFKNHSLVSVRRSAAEPPSFVLTQHVELTTNDRPPAYRRELV